MRLFVVESVAQRQAAVEPFLGGGGGSGDGEVDWVEGEVWVGGGDLWWDFHGDVLH